MNTNFLDQVEGQGFENITQDDMKVPFLRILQTLSPELDESNPDKLKNAKPGMFINTINKKIYGASIEVIPIKFEKIWLECKPNRGGIVGRHEPHSIRVDMDDFSHWKYNGNEIQECYLFYVLVIGHFEDGPLVLSLSSTGIKHAKNWNTQNNMTRLPSGKKAPYFSSVWQLKTILNKNDQGSWYTLGDKTTSITRVRFINENDYAQFVSPMRKSLDKPIELDFKQIEDNSAKQIDTNVPY